MASRYAAALTALLTVPCWPHAIVASEDAARVPGPAEVADSIDRLRPARPMHWTSIPWVDSLVQARQAGGREGCPVFLFTLDGNLASGRC
jgi:hypothetical protein